MTAPAIEWFLAEGATGSYFDLFVLLANPDSTPATVEVTYLRPARAAPLAKPYTVAAMSRFNIWVDAEEVRWTGQRPLANTAVSTRCGDQRGAGGGGTGDVVAGADGGDLGGRRTTLGATAIGLVVGAGGRGARGNAAARRPIVLVANTSACAATVQVTLVFEDGTPAVSQELVDGAGEQPGTLTPPVDFAAQFPAGTTEAVRGGGGERGRHAGARSWWSGRCTRHRRGCRGPPAPTRQPPD